MTADDSGTEPHEVDAGMKGPGDEGGGDKNAGGEQEPGKPAEQGSTKPDQPNSTTGEQAPATDQTAQADPLKVGVQSAFDLGWTMAGLANDATAQTALGNFDRLLPTEHELGRSQRSRLDVVRLECLTRTIQTSFPPNGEGISNDDLTMLETDVKAATDWKKVGEDLSTLHSDILGYLACLGRPMLLAYELGRSLHDTVISPAQARADELGGAQRPPGQDLPQTLAALTTAFDRDRIAVLQEWLATLAPHFPDDSAAVVKASLGRWSEWVTAAFVSGTPGKIKGSADEKAVVVDAAPQALLRQGDVWLNILVGSESLSGLSTPEAYIAAGEDALRRSARIIRRVALHYWFAIVIVVLAAAGLTALAAVNLEGAAKVWTQIATIGGALGITAKGIGTRVTKLADAGEKPIYRACEVDALAWAVTTLPTIELDFRGVHALRQAGIQGSAPLGRV
jgi:hypothetical protein